MQVYKLILILKFGVILPEPQTISINNRFLF